MLAWGVTTGTQHYPSRMCTLFSEATCKAHDGTHFASLGPLPAMTCTHHFPGINKLVMRNGNNQIKPHSLQEGPMKILTTPLWSLSWTNVKHIIIVQKLTLVVELWALMSSHLCHCLLRLVNSPWYYNQDWYVILYFWYCWKRYESALTFCSPSDRECLARFSLIRGKREVDRH